VLQFTNPMEVAWGAMDKTLLKRFWSERPDQFANAASISDKVLVMSRGIHLASRPPPLPPPGGHVPPLSQTTIWAIYCPLVLTHNEMTHNSRGTPLQFTTSSKQR